MGKSMRAASVAKWSALADRTPTYALVEAIDLVVVRFDDREPVLYGRCLHCRLADFNIEDLTTFKPDMAALSGVAFAGVRA